VAATALVWEGFWPLVLPFLLVIAGFLIVSWFGLWSAVPDIVRYGLLAIFAAAALAALISLRHFRFATNEQVDFRIERQSALSHQPVSAQADRLVAGDDSAFSQALWQEHQARMAKKLTGLKTGMPMPRLAARDPYAIRAAILLLAFVAFGFAYNDHLGPIKAAFTSQDAKGQDQAQITVWVSPPSYTNRPPIFLKRMAKTAENTNHASVPEGSELVVRVIGEDALSLDFVAGQKSTHIDPLVSSGQNLSDITEYHFKLATTGKARLSAKDTLLGQWSFDVLPDNDPEIRFDEPPKRGSGRMLDLAFSVEDDYGVVSAVAEIRPVETLGDPLARPLVKPPDLSLPLPRRQSGKGKIKLSRDLSRHPFAGGKMTITLVAKDGASQTGKSAIKEIILPARFFTKPLAKALVEQRRILAMDARKARDVANMLDIITNTAPEEFIKNTSTYLGLVVVHTALRNAHNDDDLREVLDLLWAIAQSIEDGDLSASAARLREAQEALKRALENGASDKEIDRLMKELRQAMNNHLNEMAKRMARDQKNQTMPQDQNSQTLRKQDLERMMDRIENLAKSGSKDAAKQLLSELQQMMDRLQAGRHQRQRQREGDQFNQQMNKLSKMMQNQQRLMDETFRMQQQKPRGGKDGKQQKDGQSSRQQGQQKSQKGSDEMGQNGLMSPQEYADAMKQLQKEQGELRDALQQMMKDMKEQGANPGRELGKAGEAMDKARDALGKGKNADALGQQGKALNALRKGAQAMMKQMQQNIAGERGGTDKNGQQENAKAKNDPLGRQQRTKGANFGGNVKVPDEIDAQKAREILDAIRKKLANPGLPKIEFNYLDRLLKPQ
jgi:uncharacterized protein (TIGR02302 family)